MDELKEWILVFAIGIALGQIAAGYNINHAIESKKEYKPLFFVAIGLEHTLIKK